MTDRETLRTLPGDDVRQIMWRFADRYDLQMLVQSTRGVARGPVAKAVAAGVRNSHEWTPAKAALLEAFDAAGVTTAFMAPEEGGYIEGPKNLALAMVAFELSWVDAGAASTSLAANLGLAPIYERGTPEQRAEYMRAATPPAPGESRPVKRAAFALTEPLPFVGVETGVMCGKVRVAEWKDGGEPILEVEKRGRFITGMGFAAVVTAAVEADDPRIKSSCMIILEETDPGSWDRGVPTRKLVHQLSSTRDPVLKVRVPAHRIIGGYDVVEGKIVPRFDHAQVIDAVFRRTRVTVGLMSAAKLLSAVEPVIRYHRTRFRGGAASEPGTPRHDLGIQMKEDAVQRLADVWATGEAAASLGFAAARVFDDLAPLEKEKDRLMAEKGVKGPRAEMKALKAPQAAAVAWLEARAKDPAAPMPDDPLVRFALLDSEANVLCPATKLYCGTCATVMREAVSLCGGYGITEDCPGFLFTKWIDTQLECTYEGPEAVQRRQLSITMATDVFTAMLRCWAADLDRLSARSASSGRAAATVAAGLRLWLRGLAHLEGAADGAGQKLWRGARHGASYPMTDALTGLLAARQFLLDAVELEEKGPAAGAAAEGLGGLVAFLHDLAHVQAARVAGEAARVVAEAAHGYRAAGGAPDAALDEIRRLRDEVDASLAGSRLAKDRAAAALTKVMIPEALDYPV